MPTPQLSRSIAEMTERLDAQVHLLSEYYAKAFDEGDPNYLTEVANKLRLLLVRSRKNTPLLLELADRIGVRQYVIVNSPFSDSGDATESGTTTQVPIEKFFQQDALFLQTSIGPRTFTGIDIIRACCEQLGGAHEDWEVDVPIAEALQFPVLINDQHHMAYLISSMARSALDCGRDLVHIARRRLLDGTALSRPAARP